jgi:hypothetical protein
MESERDKNDGGNWYKQCSYVAPLDNMTYIAPYSINIAISDREYQIDFGKTSTTVFLRLVEQSDMIECFLNTYRPVHTRQLKSLLFEFPSFPLFSQRC